MNCKTLSLHFSKTIGTNAVRSLLGEFAQRFARCVHGATPAAKETFTLKVRAAQLTLFLSLTRVPL